MAKPSWATRTNLKQQRTNSDTVPSWAHRAKRLKGLSKVDTPRGWSLKTVAAKLALILPAWWCKLCIEAAYRSTDQSTIFGVEAFSGKGMLARALSNHIGPFVTFELQDDSRDNLLLKKAFYAYWHNCFVLVQEDTFTLARPARAGCAFRDRTRNAVP